jgi:NADH-quinone oxidoreductase subunit M
MGDPGARPTAAASLPDVRRHEYAAWTPLAALTVLAGLWPAALLTLTTPAVQSLLPGATP